MKFVDGLMIHSGQPVNDYIQQAVRHVQLRQGGCWIAVMSYVEGVVEVVFFKDWHFKVGK